MDALRVALGQLDSDIDRRADEETDTVCVGERDPATERETVVDADAAVEIEGSIDGDLEGTAVAQDVEERPIDAENAPLRVSERVAVAVKLEAPDADCVNTDEPEIGADADDSPLGDASCDWDWSAESVADAEAQKE